METYSIISSDSFLSYAEHQGSLLHLLLLARANLACKHEAQSTSGPSPSVHTDLSSCMEDVIVWNGPVSWEEAMPLLVF